MIGLAVPPSAALVTIVARAVLVSASFPSRVIELPSESTTIIEVALLRREAIPVFTPESAAAKFCKVSVTV